MTTPGSVFANRMPPVLSLGRGHLLGLRASGYFAMSLSNFSARTLTLL